jgi:hypothetical protein
MILKTEMAARVTLNVINDELPRQGYTAGRQCLRSRARGVRSGIRKLGGCAGIALEKAPSRR